MNKDDKGKSERMCTEPVTAAILSRQRGRKIAAGKWRKDKVPTARPADQVSWELRTDGARIIIQMAKEMAAKSNAKLDVINWLAYPAHEAPHGISDTYTLVARAGKRLERQVFLREDLEQAPDSERTRNRLRTILKTFLAALQSSVAPRARI